MTPEKVTVAKKIAAALGVMIVVSLFIPYKTCPPRPPQSQAENQLKQLSLACRAYAADWEGGEYPPTLDSLFPDYIDDEEFFFATDPNGKKIAIIYRGGNPEVIEGEKLPLLEWPIPFRDKILIVNTGGHITEERIKP